ncbi:MAG: 2-oxoglutarate/2-oxoacid ferredoxin oxidoreductase subunit alpha [Thermodesulfobacteriota bacterium]|nr:2-oxoglutarate/2-oxoacid ferredoxin oxidoreductase subunit alpha [Thermodesulfobacteriota bacterium]
MTYDSLNIVVGGEAGQGLATVGQVLAKALVKAGYSIVVTQSYQSRIRGGYNSYALRVSTRHIEAPVETIDVLAAFSLEAYRLNRGLVVSSGLIVLADERVTPLQEAAACLSIKTDKNIPYANVFALGAVGALLGLPEEFLEEALNAFFSDHHAEALQKNLDSLSQGIRWGSSRSDEVKRMLTPTRPRSLCMMHGNEAIAFGAMSAGLKFFSFYPMTPATSVATTLCEHSEKMDFFVEQAEDEIAAINMAIGASYAGAPSMVATSGGGFALMTEAVSLAGMTETPIVIVVAQRPGPSTGLPTRTEQGDLEFVLHAGHGEFPRAVFAPGTVEECFHLTRKAFDLAELSRGPVFLLTDQFLADSYRAIEPFDFESLPVINVCNELAPENKAFQTYAITESGVSPRVLPGLTTSCVRAWSSEQLVIADSDEHTEDGHLTEDLDVRNLMMEKRWRKFDLIKQQVVPPLFEGDEDPEILLICWGSTRGVAKETVSTKQKQGVTCAMLHFSQVWPIIPTHVLGRLQKARRVIGVEANYTGQFCRLLKRETGFDIREQILRYDGLPFTLEYVLDRIR